MGAFSLIVVINLLNSKKCSSELIGYVTLVQRTQYEQLDSVRCARC